MTPRTPWFASTRPASNCSVRFDRPCRRERGCQLAWITYERKGVCHQLVMCEPLRGWRHVQVTERRTRKDYAACIRELVDLHFPKARKIRLVQDNLNTHDGASL